MNCAGLVRTHVARPDIHSPLWYWAPANTQVISCIVSTAISKQVGRMVFLA